MPHAPERHFTSFEALELEPVCRLACKLLGVPVVAIIVKDAPYRWVHVANEKYQSLAAAILETCPLEWDARSATPEIVSSISFGPENIAELIVIDTVPHALSSEEDSSLGQLVDIASSLLRQIHDNIRLSHQLGFYRMLAEASTDTIVRGDLNGIRLYVSPSIKELLGYEPDELVGKQAIDLTHPDDLAAMANMMHVVRTGHAAISTQEMRQRHKDGHWVWLEAALRLTYDGHSGEIDGYVVSVRGIDNRKELEGRLQRIADYDEMTGLPNRASFRRLLEGRIRTGGVFTLLYMDLDGFKKVNDTLGHGAGDIVLKDVAQRLKASLRAGEIAARFGGDEFTVIVEAGPEGIGPLCQRMIDSIALPFFIDGAIARVGLSIGAACSVERGENLDTMLSRADRVLYDAKAAGKNTFRTDSRSTADADDVDFLQTNAASNAPRHKTGTHNGI